MHFEKQENNINKDGGRSSIRFTKNQGRKRKQFKKPSGHNDRCKNFLGIHISITGCQRLLTCCYFE